MIWHALLISLNQVDALLTRLEGALGFTPSGRGRLGLAELPALDKLESLNARRERGQHGQVQRRHELDADDPLRPSTECDPESELESPPTG